MNHTILDKLLQIGTATGDDKKFFLSRSPELKKILLYCYDPFRRYYMQAPEEEEGLYGGCEIDDDVFDLLDKLSSRQLSGHEARDEVIEVMSYMDPIYVNIFKMVLNKDLRLGIGIKSINEVWPNHIPTTDDGSAKPSIMLCKTFDPNRAKYPLVAAVKKDGVRGRVVDYPIRTRAGHKFIGFEHIEDELEKYGFEKDGEVCVPGVDFDGSSGLIRNHQKVPNAVYWFFDVPSVDETKWGRYLFMKDHIDETDHIKIVEHRLINDIRELNDFYIEALDMGEEGLVIYTNDHKYRDCRSWDWTRLVPIKKADCKVIGFEEGKGKFKNSLGKLIIDFGGHRVKVGTGFNEKPWSDMTTNEQTNATKQGRGSDEDDYESRRRGYIWENQEITFGLIGEFHYKEKTKAGSMRQPRFKGWRRDKSETSID